MILLRTNMGSHIKAVRRRVLGDSVGDFKEHGVEMPSSYYRFCDGTDRLTSSQASVPLVA